MAKNFETIRKVNQLKNKMFDSRLKSIFNSTICFFRDDDKKVIAPAGSGMFIKGNNSYYVVTAAHVLAENSNNIFVILDDAELTLGGRLVSSPMPESGSREDDKIDISILKLDDYSAQRLLTRFTPVELTEIELGHTLTDTATYFSVGYPLTRTKAKRGEKNLKSTAHAYQSVPNLKFDFQRFGFSNSTTLAIEYDQLVTSAEIPETHYSPDLTGISGSGIWHLNGTSNKRLIGITIERINETDFKCMLATKIDVVIDMINKMN